MRLKSAGLIPRLLFLTSVYQDTAESLLQVVTNRIGQGNGIVIRIIES
jgi:hypothetical protein